MAGFLFKTVLPLCAAAFLPASDSVSIAATNTFSSFTGPINANEDGRLVFFGIGQNNSIWSNCQIRHGSNLNAWIDLGGPRAKPGMVAARNSNGTLEVFVIGGDNNIWHSWQRGPNGLWADWYSMEGSGITSLATAVNADGRIQIFGAGTNGAVWSNWQLAPNSVWHGWADFGGPGIQSGFVAGQNIDGSLELFGVAGDNNVWHKRQICANGPWGDWTNLGGGGILPRLTVGRNSDGHLELFGVRNSEIWHIVQTTSGGNQWGDWTTLAGPGIQPGFVAAVNADGHLELFGVGNNGNVWHLWQINGDVWNEWTDMGGPGCDPQLAVGNNSDGCLELFGIGNNTDVWHVWQVGPNGGWSSWNDMGGPGTKLFSGQGTRRIPQYAGSVWQTGEGLPGNAVNAILQTPDGYLWVGTQKGLARFDGQQFLTLDSMFPEFPAQCVNALCKGKKGELWIGVENGGLFCLTAGRLKRYQKSDGLADDNVKTIYAAADGSVWIGASGGLSRFENGKFQTYTTVNGLADNDIRAIVEDDDGVLWIGTSRGLNTFQNGFISAVYTNLNELPDRRGIPIQSVTALCPDATGGLWIGTANGIVHRRGGNFRDHFRSDNLGLSDDFIGALHLDRNGFLWIGTYGGMNCWAEGNACITLLDNEGSGFDQITAICEDSEGNIWAGGKEGLRQLKPKVITTYGRQAGFTQNNIMSVREDKDHAIWAAIRGGGLNRFKDGKITTYSTGQALKTDLILSTCERRDGSIWFGADRDFGLYYLKQKTVKRFEGDNGMLNGPIRVLYEDQQTNLWIGGGKQLTLLRDGKLTGYTTNNGLAGNVVQAILEDHEGGLWFGTSTGLSRFTDGKFTNFTTQQGLSANSIDALYEDGERSLWIGTIGGGINRLRDGKFHSYTTAQGLFSDDVLEILEDNNGCLWMSSFNGIFRAQKQSLDDFDRRTIKGISCVSFGKADGMASEQCNGAAKPAGWKSRDGRLWFPTTKGLVVADPNVKINSVPPPVVIEKIIADKKVSASGNLSSVSIEPGRGELEFHYTALSFQAPEKNRFKYKLNGYDTDWVEAGTRRVAYYNNLRPGNYQFHVIACNNDGIWNETGATGALTLLPHFWQTWWFFSLCGGALVAFIGGGARYVTTKRIQRKLELIEHQHAIQRERARIAEDMHDDLGIRLTEILLLGNLAANSSADTVKEHVDKIVKVSRDVVRSLDAIVWVVNPKNDSLDQLALYTCEYLERLLGMTAIRCRLDIPDELPHHPLTASFRHNLFLVIKEAINNIVKHSQATELRFSLQVTGSILSVVIEDDGKGFPIAENSSHGNGLRNMEKRMTNIGGSFNLSGEPGKGTRISLQVPLNGA